MPRIMLFDIEATALIAEMGRVLCVSVGEIDLPTQKVGALRTFVKKNDDPADDKEVVREACDLLRQADGWVTYYGARYDVPMLQSRLLANKLKTMPINIPHIDLWKTSRWELKLRSNRLANVEEFLQLDERKTKIDWNSWIRAAAGWKKEMAYVVDHCKKDIRVLDQAYKKMLPLIRSHPRFGNFLGASGVACKTCGSERLTKYGLRCNGASGLQQRWLCHGCGTSDTLTKIRKETAK